MCCCEEETRKKIAFILIMICAFVIFVLSFAQLCNKGAYGYKDILSKVEEFNNSLENENFYCDEYISDIKSKKKFAKIKTIINFIYSLYVFILGLSRLQNVKEYCKLGMLYSFILLFGIITELTLTSLAYSYFDETDFFDSNLIDCDRDNEYNNEYNNYYDYDNDYYYDNVFTNEHSFERAKEISHWVIKFDLVIIYLSAASVIPIFYLFFAFLSDDCNSYTCIKEEFFWICSGIYNCMEKCCCGSCNECCKSFGECCKKCKKNDLTSLREDNDELIRENTNLENDITNLNNEINDLIQLKNIGENNFISERKKLDDEILDLNKKTKENLDKEKNLNDEIDEWKGNNDNLEKEIKKLKS